MCTIDISPMYMKPTMNSIMKHPKQRFCVDMFMLAFLDGPVLSLVLERFPVGLHTSEPDALGRPALADALALSTNGAQS